MDEFDVIRTYLKPLAQGLEGALDLEDDAALLSPSTGREFVISTDALIAGVHFFNDDPPDLIARKSLRVNLSDLAAMGADPECYSLALALPTDLDEKWLAAFCSGLDQDQQEYGIHLSGGDTTTTPGPLTIAVTAIGSVPIGKAIKRSTAKAGDDIWVTGTIGDAALGLQRIKDNPKQSEDLAQDDLVKRYWLPDPKLSIAPLLRELVTAAADVSDGLVADLNHICAASKLGAIVNADDVPVSQNAVEFMETREGSISDLVTGGDDYELLFVANRENRHQINELSARANTRITLIGEMTAEGKLIVVDTDNQPMPFSIQGYRHF